MFNIVLEKLNVVGVWYTYDQIIPTGMDWSLCAFHKFSDHVFLIIREPGYWYQQPLSDNKKCQIAVCSSVAYGTYWQPDTTGVVITPLQQIHIDNRGQPACRSLMGLGWGCPIDCIASNVRSRLAWCDERTKGPSPFSRTSNSRYIDGRVCFGCNVSSMFFVCRGRVICIMVIYSTVSWLESVVHCKQVEFTCQMIMCLYGKIENES